MRPRSVTHADFLFDPTGRYRIVTGDEDGVLRLYDYDPIGEPVIRFARFG